MKTAWFSFLSALPKGARWVVLLYALGYPVALIGKLTHTFNVYAWLSFVPALVWKGQVWRLVTHAFVAGGPVDYAVSLFWLATLVAVLGRNWSSLELWTYCLLATVAGALLLAGAGAHAAGLVGNYAMIFGLLFAWYRLYGRERLILLGFGEISVRQAAVLVVIIEILILVFCAGLIVTGAMMAGGAVSWLTLVLRGRQALNRRAQVSASERIARLEL